MLEQNKRTLFPSHPGILNPSVEQMKGFMCCASERDPHEAIAQAQPLQSPGQELTALLWLMWQSPDSVTWH